MSKLSRIAGKVFLSSIKCAKFQFNGNVYCDKDKGIYFYLDGDMDYNSIEQSFNDEKENLKDISKKITEFLIQYREHEVFNEINIPETLNISDRDYKFLQNDADVLLFLPISALKNTGENDDQENNENDDQENKNLLEYYSGHKQDFIEEVIENIKTFLDKEINSKITFFGGKGVLSLKSNSHSYKIDDYYSLNLKVNLDTRKNNRYFQITTSVNIENSISDTTTYEKSFYISSNHNLEEKFNIKEISKEKKDSVSFKFENNKDNENKNALKNFIEKMIDTFCEAFEKDLTEKLSESEGLTG